MSGRPGRRWADADELLEEWARVSAYGRRARPGVSEQRPPLLVAAAAVVAGLAVIAAVSLAIVLARPVGLGAPPGPTPAPQTDAPDTPPVGELRGATWRVDPVADVSPESTSIPLLLTERECASGQSPEGRVAEPVIEYTAEAVRILLRVHMIGGDCPSNPEYAMTVELSEPIGQRVLVDLGEEPPAQRWSAITSDCAAAEIGARVFRLMDGTGLVKTCEVFPGNDLGASTVHVSNPGDDHGVLEIGWPDGACGDRTISFLGDAGGYSLVIQAEPFEGECPAVGLYFGARLELAEDVPAELVRAEYRGEFTPRPAPATPTPAVDASFRERAMAWLTELTQLTCFEDTEGGPLIDDSAYDRLVGLAGGDGWAAVDGVWVGERRWAPTAFGTWEVLEESAEWALIARWAGHYPQALGLRTYTRPGQPPVTVKVYELHVCGDPAWQGATDPASGTPPGFQRPADAPHPDGLRTDLADCAELDVASTSDDSGMSYEYKTMSFTYFDSDGNEQYAEVRFTDAACQDHPVIGRLIGHLIETVTETDAPIRTQGPDDPGE